MAENRSRAGVIGTGFMGLVHVEALHRLGVEVVALAGGTLDDAAAKASEMGVSRWYGSAEELLADPTIDVVHVTSPSHLHFAHAMAALEAGKHVVCEAPLAKDRRGALELVNLAQKKRLVNVAAFNLRFYPSNRYSRSVVEKRELGDVYVAQGSYLHDWRLEQAPGLAVEMPSVLDMASHWNDLIWYITGLQVEAVLADFGNFSSLSQQSTRHGETSTGGLQGQAEQAEPSLSSEDCVNVLLQYVGGPRGVLTVSQVSSGRKNRTYYEINGSRSSLAWNSEQPNELRIGHTYRPTELVLNDPALRGPNAQHTSFYPVGQSEGFPDTFKSLFSSVYDYLDKADFTVEPGFPTFADGYRELLVSEAILRSADEKRWVKVSEISR